MTEKEKMFKAIRVSVYVVAGIIFVRFLFWLLWYFGL
nr:MAG TPA: TMEM238 protein family protein [Microviridae sp.]